VFSSERGLIMTVMVLDARTFVLLRCAARGTWLAAVFLGLTACSPTYDWREWLIEGDLAAWMPCKPAKVSRDVHLGSQSLTMTVHGCEAGGQSWAISQVHVTDPALAASVQQALNEALAANLATRLPRAQVPDAIGLVQARELKRYVLQGRGPDGRVVSADIWSFVRGAQVYQASVLQGGVTTSSADKDARDTYFGSLKFGR
jgi:hypothetical protein